MPIIENKIVAGGLSVIGGLATGFVAYKMCDAVGLDTNPAATRSIAEDPSDEIVDGITNLLREAGIGPSAAEIPETPQGLIMHMITEGAKMNQQQQAEREALKKEVESKTAELEQHRSELDKLVSANKVLQDRLDENKAVMERLANLVTSLKQAEQESNQNSAVANTAAPPVSPQVQQESIQEQVTESELAESLKQAGTGEVPSSQQEPVKEETEGNRLLEGLIRNILSRDKESRTETALDNYLSNTTTYASGPIIPAMFDENGNPTKELHTLLIKHRIVAPDVTLANLQKETKVTIYKKVSRLLRNLATLCFQDLKDDIHSDEIKADLSTLCLDLVESLVCIGVYKLDRGKDLNHIFQLLKSIVSKDSLDSKDNAVLVKMINDMVKEQTVEVAKKDKSALAILTNLL